MPTNSETEQSLRIALKVKGLQLTKQRRPGETGVDIIASRNGTSYHIEVIGFKTSPPARTRDFCQAFFQTISRLNEGASHCAIALLQKFSLGLHQRAKQYFVGWERIGLVFPELEIWLVDTDKNTYIATAWNSWLKQKIL